MRDDLANFLVRSQAVSTHRPPVPLNIQQAAEVVCLPESAVRALAAAGYLASSPAPCGSHPDAGPCFDLADLKAFVARNAGNGADGTLARALTPDLEPQELVARLDERAEEMALRMLKMYATVFPQAAAWPPDRQHRFVQRTKARFEAILAIAALGDKFEPELLEDLEAIGASAARNAVQLPQILALLRVSRDMVVQNAIDLAENGERPGGHALSLLLTRILPAMDRLADALTAGYWEAMFPG
jgi:hypothetical protein